MGLGEEFIHDPRFTTVPQQMPQGESDPHPARTYPSAILTRVLLAFITAVTRRSSNIRTVQSSTGHGHRCIGEAPDRIPHPAMTNHPEPSPSGSPPQEILFIFPYRRWP